MLIRLLGPVDVVGDDGSVHHSASGLRRTLLALLFSFPGIAALAARMPGLQQQLFKLLSQDIGKAALLAGNYTADERMAAFLVSLSRRFGARGFSATRFRLTMTRTDIANYLRLASESVSRGFRRLQDEGLVRVDRREIELVDLTRLTAMASSILRL